MVVTTEESEGSALCEASPDAGADDSDAADSEADAGVETATDPGTVVVVVGATEPVVDDVETGADDDVELDDGTLDDDAPIWAAGSTVVFCVTGGDARSAFITVSRPEVRPRCQFSQSWPP